MLTRFWEQEVEEEVSFDIQEIFDENQLLNYSQIKIKLARPLVLNKRAMNPRWHIVYVIYKTESPLPTKRSWGGSEVAKGRHLRVS